MLSDIAALVSALVGLAGAASAGLVFLLSRRWKTRAEQLRLGWQVESDPQTTGALVYNGSKFPLQQLVVTVACGARGKTFRRHVAVLKADDTHVWRTSDMHGSGAESVDGRKHDTEPHRVHATFRNGKGYWLRDERKVERVRSLVVWAEKRRAATLRRYLGRNSAFRHTYKLAVKVEEFERTEALETAFARVAETRRPPSGYEQPDVIAGPHDWMGRVVDEDWVVKPEPAPEGLLRMAPVAVDALTRGDSLFAVPYVLDSVALLRNDALAGNGELPGTFEELVTAGTEALRANGISDGVPVALQVGTPDAAGNAGDPYHLWPLFASLGGSFFGLRGDPSGPGRFDEPSVWRDDFVAALVRLAELGTKHGGVLDPGIGRSESLPMFLDGRAPFLVCSSRALAAVKERGMRVTTATVPALGERPATPLVSVYGFYVNRRAKNLPAAQDLLTTYLSLPSAGEDLNKIQQLVPAQQEAMATVADADPVLRAYVEQCERGMPMPSLPEMRTAWQLLGRAEYDLLAGERDPREDRKSVV